MFIVIARYRVAAAHQHAFVHESSEAYRPGLACTPGFRRLLFLRHVADPEYLDVLTEWDNVAAFLAHARMVGFPALRTPHEVRERFLYETLDGRKP